MQSIVLLSQIAADSFYDAPLRFSNVYASVVIDLYWVEFGQRASYGTVCTRGAATQLHPDGHRVVNNSGFEGLQLGCYSCYRSGSGRVFTSQDGGVYRFWGATVGGLHSG